MYLLNQGACDRCGAKRDVLIVYYWHPPQLPWRTVATVGGRARCWERQACAARVAKRRKATSRRSGIFVLEEPRAPNAPRGWCRWCGADLLRGDGRRDKRRNYCYSDREGRDCVDLWNGSRTYQPRTAVRHRARQSGTALGCVDCGLVVEEHRDGHWVELWREHATYDHEKYRWIIDPAHPEWEADHEIPLEDGGEHTLENLRCRCVFCHRAKTSRESVERAARRRVAA